VGKRLKAIKKARINAGFLNTTNEITNQ